MLLCTRFHVLSVWSCSTVDASAHTKTNNLARRTSSRISRTASGRVRLLCRPLYVTRVTSPLTWAVDSLCYRCSQEDQLSHGGYVEITALMLV